MNGAEPAMGLHTRIVGPILFALLTCLSVPIATTEDTPSRCPTTRPPAPAFVPPSPYPAVPPGHPAWFWLGSSELWIKLPLSGAWPALQSGEKVFWWREGFNGARETRPAIVVSGRRFDAESPSVVLASRGTNTRHDSFGGWALLTGISTGSPGCWEISAQYRTQQLTFIAWVP
jgi:hypothetical protein